LNNRLAPNAAISVAQLYLDITNASDHLPVVADYTIPIPAPVISTARVAGSDLVLTVTNGITNGTYTMLTSTDVRSALATWTPVQTNTATAGTFTLTITNAVSGAAGKVFYTLRTQ